MRNLCDPLTIEEGIKAVLMLHQKQEECRKRDHCDEQGRHYGFCSGHTYLHFYEKSGICTGCGARYEILTTEKERKEMLRSLQTPMMICSGR